MKTIVDINWSELGFSYIKTDLRYLSLWQGGKWDEGRLTEDNTITISEGSPALHYGQQCFEGLKAYRTAGGKTVLFRPDQNAKRMNRSCQRLLMPEIPEDKFINACLQVVKANERWIPPYRMGSLYIRPYVIGVGDNIGVKPADTYLFGIFCLPVGPYFKGGMKPVNFVISDYDRAAPYGTGAVKVGGNYAASLYPHKLAVDGGFTDCIYTDPATHTKIEEVGAANFFGITGEQVFVTPKSDSILPSITRYSLMYLAESYLGKKVEERDVYVDRLYEFKEAGACGTAAVITPIGGIECKGKMHLFDYHEEVGPTTKVLYDLLTGIQFGDESAPDSWIVEV
ncbi:branched-chain amino acid aminotransferase [Bacillota bacterium]